MYSLSSYGILSRAYLLHLYCSRTHPVTFLFSLSASAEGTKGCGLGIAYTDDAKSVKPEDFTIFSVNHTCVWTRNTRYEIPEDLPPCPNGKCTCFWGWIHAEGNGEGYGSEMYMVSVSLSGAAL